MDKIRGVLNASPEKRYKHFLSTVADTEQVWLLKNNDGYACYDDGDGYSNLIVYPAREYAEMFCGSDEPELVEVHDFVDRCSELLQQDEIRFMVFPNQRDSYIVDAKKMYYDVMSALDEIE